MVKFNYAFGLSILILTVLISGCVNSNKPNPESTPIKSFDYSTKLSFEEQKIVGYWNSQSGVTALVYNDDRTGRRIARETKTDSNRNYCIESGDADNVCILDNETYNWRIEKGANS